MKCLVVTEHIRILILRETAVSDKSTDKDTNNEKYGCW